MLCCAMGMMLGVFYLFCAYVIDLLTAWLMIVCFDVVCILLFKGRSPGRGNTYVCLKQCCLICYNYLYLCVLYEVSMSNAMRIVANACSSRSSLCSKPMRMIASPKAGGYSWLSRSSFLLPSNFFSPCWLMYVVTNGIFSKGSESSSKCSISVIYHRWTNRNEQTYIYIYIFHNYIYIRPIKTPAKWPDYKLVRQNPKTHK